MLNQPTLSDEFPATVYPSTTQKEEQKLQSKEEMKRKGTESRKTNLCDNDITIKRIQQELHEK